MFVFNQKFKWLIKPQKKVEYCYLINYINRLKIFKSIKIKIYKLKSVVCGVATKHMNLVVLPCGLL